MYLKENINGYYVTLKSIDESDAEFSLEIRQDPEFSKYLPGFDITVEEQREWIKKQREKNDDYFWIVLDKEGNRIGTVGVFEIFDEFPKSGRLALRGNALQNIEATYLAYKYGLDILKVPRMGGFIYSDNTRAIRFAEMFGGTVGEPYEHEGRTVREAVFKHPNFAQCEEKINKMLYRNIDFIPKFPEI